jgi:anti-sigma factor RsiW
LGRPFEKHIDDNELSVLVPWPSETGRGIGLSGDTLLAAKSHVSSCIDCAGRVLEYRRIVSQFSNLAFSESAPEGTDCPTVTDVGWREVAAGSWPEWKARQLIVHASLCDHCGPLLRAAASNRQSVAGHGTALSRLKAESRSDPIGSPISTPSSSSWQVMKWLVPVAALVVIIGIFAMIPSSSPTSLSGPKFAEFAVRAHREHLQGKLALDVHSDSQEALNEWFKAKAQFAVSLPASPATTGEDRPYRLEGARLLPISDKTAAFISYRMPTVSMTDSPVSLVVTPDSIAIASGGIEVDFKKVSFHYATVQGYKVVTWSVHGLTYALVSQEGNRTQRSCMVCHSALRDRDLSQTPTPLPQREVIEPISQ